MKNISTKAARVEATFFFLQDIWRAFKYISTWVNILIGGQVASSPARARAWNGRSIRQLAKHFKWRRRQRWWRWPICVRRQGGRKLVYESRCRRLELQCATHPIGMKAAKAARIRGRGQGKPSQTDPSTGADNTLMTPLFAVNGRHMTSFQFRVYNHGRRVSHGSIGTPSNVDLLLVPLQ